MGQAHILVVEDEPAELTAMVGVLRAAGWRVTPVARGTAALKSARADRPDVAVIDLLMPGLDGFQLCLMFKHDPLLNSPIVVVTGRSSEDDRKRALATGAEVFLAKPFKGEQLVAAVRGLLAPDRISGEA